MHLLGVIMEEEITAAAVVVSEEGKEELGTCREGEREGGRDVGEGCDHTT